MGVFFQGSVERSCGEGGTLPCELESSVPFGGREGYPYSSCDSNLPVYYISLFKMPAMGGN